MPRYKVTFTYTVQAPEEDHVTVTAKNDDDAAEKVMEMNGDDYDNLEIIDTEEVSD